MRHSVNGDSGAASIKRVCLIGAGSSGIAAAKALHERAIPFDIEADQRATRERYVASKRHTIQVDFDVLLLDEVLAVGDESFQQKCMVTFERFRSEGKTMVLVSHDLAAIGNHCDRALLLEGGVARALGPPDEVIDAYLRREHARVG